MHILVITPGFPKDEGDTDCIPPMQEYFRFLKKNYPLIKITVVSIHYPYRHNLYEWNNIKVFNCGASRAPQPKRFLYWFRALYYTLKINREMKIDIIHSFWFTEATLIAYFACKILGIKHICTLMGQDAKKENKYLKLLPTSKIIIVTLSEKHSICFLESTGAKSDKIIPWGIEKTTPRQNERSIDIIGVGALIPVKNFGMFIDVIAEIKKEFPTIKCLLVGEGEERDFLEDKICRLKLENNITLTGHLKHEEVLNVMNNSRVLLHTAEYEAYGYVMAEALAYGCYVVCRNVGCANRTKKLFVPYTLDEMILTINHILELGLDYGPEIINSISDTTDSYFQLYKKSINDNGKGNRK